MWPNPSLPALLVGTQSGAASGKSAWQPLSRAALWPSKSTPTYVPKSQENTCPCKGRAHIIHSSILYNSRKVTTVPMSISWWMGKQHVVCPYSGLTFNHKTQWNIETLHSTDEPWWRCAQWRQPDTARHIQWVRLCEMSRAGRYGERTGTVVTWSGRRGGGSERYGGGGDENALRLDSGDAAQFREN